MWRLISFRNSARDERGATALMVAIIVPVVLLGLGAIVINVGGWYVARGMDQNSADAAAVAVALTCAEGACDASAADQYADGANNGQLAGEPWIVCGTAPGLTACDSAIENGQVCPVANESPYVDVYVRPVDGTMNNPVGGTDQAVAACAQAAISGASSCADCVALTISKCEWDINTNNGETFATHEEGTDYSNGSPPSYIDTIQARRADSRFDVSGSNIYVDAGIEDPQTPQGTASIAGSETTLFTHGSDSHGSCGGAANGLNGPGQFGWLAGAGDPCTAEISGSTYEGDPGNNPVKACADVFDDSRNDKKPIYMPVYTSVSGSTYTLAGFAAFVVTGWDVQQFEPPDKKRDSLIAEADTTTGFPHTKETYCGKPPGGFTTSNSDVCISGYFTQALVSADEVGGSGGDDLGVTVVSLAG